MRLSVSKMNWPVSFVILLSFVLICTYDVDGFLLSPSVTNGTADNYHGSSSQYSDGQCDSYHTFNELMHLTLKDQCLTIDSVFAKLRDMTTFFGNGECRIKLIQKLANYFGQHPTNQLCACRGNNTFQKYEHDPSFGDHANCLKYGAYKAMYDQFFINHDAHAISDCRTHHSVWYMLDQIQIHDRHGTCQKDMVYHISNAIRKYGDPCDCSVQCTNFNSYNVLMDTDNCMSANSVWHYLYDVENSNVQCRKNLIQHLADTYRSTGSHCDCQRTGAHYNHYHNYNHRHSSYEHYSCENVYGSRYIDIENMLSYHTNGCLDQSYLWPKLVEVRNYHSSYSTVDCTDYLIVKAARQYPRSSADPCQCSKKATTTSTTRQPTTTEPPANHNNYVCDEVHALTDIASANHVHNAGALPCDLTGNDESLVLNECNVTSSKLWRKGRNVIADCQTGSHSIQKYVPIATFTSDTYLTGGGYPAIFVKCTPNGFMAIVEHCGDRPRSIELPSGPVANAYFTIV